MEDYKVIPYRSKQFRKSVHFHTHFRRIWGKDRVSDLLEKIWQRYGVLVSGLPRSSGLSTSTHGFQETVWHCKQRLTGNICWSSGHKLQQDLLSFFICGRRVKFFSSFLGCLQNPQALEFINQSIWFSSVLLTQVFLHKFQAAVIIK